METRETSDTDLPGAMALTAAFGSGRETPERELSRRLERIERHEGRVNALTSVQRASAETRLRELSRRPPGAGEFLRGVPVVIKENIQKRGFPVQCGSRILEGYVGGFDAAAIEGLEAAGAVCLATSNMDEFGMGSSNESSVHGPVRNPHDPSRVAGGSSGGSAAACALGYAPLCLGSDTGGSVRQPAAFCGVYGFKPGYGRVSRYGLVAYGSSLDQIGAFARNPRDLDLALRAIAFHDPRDATSAPGRYPGVGSLRAGGEGSGPEGLRLDGLRVGVPRALLGDGAGLDGDVARAFDSTLSGLKERGARLVDVDIEGIEHSIAVYYLIACAEASSNLARFDGIRYGRRCEGARDLREVYDRSRAEGFGTEVKRRILLGTFALSAGYEAAYYRKAQVVRGRIARAFARAFEQVDTIFTPTAPTVAFPLGGFERDPVAMYRSDMFTVPANLAGLCAVSVPVPPAERGNAVTSALPVGMQFMGSRGSDATLVALAIALEEAGLARAAPLPEPGREPVPGPGGAP